MFVSSIGQITHIQRFSVDDGPGIRTTVFFKGCNLHCPWCHNPETWSSQPQLAFYKNICSNCGQCSTLCTAHTMIDGIHSLNRDLCRACGRCVDSCPNHCLELIGKTPPPADILNILLQDLEFYNNSDGGVTFSGGEPLLQADYCALLAHLCSQNGLDIVVDTAANVPFSAFEKVLPFVNTFYVDLKGSTDKSYQLLGGNLSLVLNNISRLVHRKASVVARIPVIPHHNDSLEDMTKMATLLKEVGVQTVHLLPFHKHCTYKYDALGLAYSYRYCEPPTPQQMDLLASAFTDFSVTIKPPL